MRARHLCIVLALAAGGCGAILQNVKPVARFEGKDICIVQNDSVRKGFVETYTRVLVEKGYAVKELPASAGLAACPVTSTYRARWLWNPAFSPEYVEIRVYDNGKQIGHAVYDASRGGLSTTNVTAEDKIAELVNQLFPAGPGS
jgi:hypothetical protein